VFKVCTTLCLALVRKNIPLSLQVALHILLFSHFIVSPRVASRTGGPFESRLDNWPFIPKKSYLFPLSLFMFRILRTESRRAVNERIVREWPINQKQVYVYRSLPNNINPILSPDWLASIT
jgi:hypothetical protein